MKRLVIGMAIVVLATGCSTDKIYEWTRENRRS